MTTNARGRYGLPTASIALGSGRYLTVHRASNILARLRGLLGREPLTPAEGLVIEPCNSIHTFGMGYEIDVVFLSADWRVLAISADLVRGRVAGRLAAARVLELRGGAAAMHDIKVGDLLRCVEGPRAAQACTHPDTARQEG